MQNTTIIQVSFQERELCSVERDDFCHADEQVAYVVLFDLEDGAEVISIEVGRHVLNKTYLCHIVMINKRYSIQIESNGRGVTKRQAIVMAFERTKITFTPTLAELNPHPDIYRYRVKPVMEAIAQQLGVKRYQVFSAGSDPLD